MIKPSAVASRIARSTSKSLVRRVFVALASFVVCGSAAADGFTSSPPFDPLYPNPPYLQTNVDEYMVTVWEADRAAIEAVLPPGLRPAASNTVGMSHYIVKEGAGLAPYEASYLFAEVDGFDEPGGPKGRFVLYGLYSPDRVVSAMREVLGFPMRLGATKVVETGKRVRGAGSRDGREVLVSEVVNRNDAAGAAGTLPYVALRVVPTAMGNAVASSELLMHPVAWTARVTMADPVAVKILLPDNHPLRKLEPKKLLYAYTGRDVNWVFGHSKLVEVRK